MGESAPWVEGRTLGAVLRETAVRHPDEEAIVFPSLATESDPRGGGRGYRRTYRQLDQDVDRVSRALIAMGIECGDHVGVWATNWPRWILLQWATARIGAVLVTVNPSYRSSELAFVLKQSRVKSLFLTDRFRNSNYHEILAEAVPDVRHSGSGFDGFPSLEAVVSIKDVADGRIQSWEDFVGAADRVPATEVDERERQLDPADAINIQYTSGTTGTPKGATLTHRNLALNAFYTGECQRVGVADRICAPVPFYHCFGCVLAVICCAVHGSTLVIPAEYFEAERTLSAIAEERATAVYGVPTMFIGMLEHPDRGAYDCKSLRTGIMAGSPCPIEVMRRVGSDLGANEMTIAYGLTEASPVITQTRTDDAIEVRVETVGRPLPGIEVRIIDPATGDELTDGSQGELCSRGHGVMLGYYDLPERTAEVIDSDGWLHSGDLACRTPNGYYRITGRIKDMICRGGENIYPREIEEVLYAHPDVEDVAVVGIPDPRLVEDVAAWIRPRSGGDLTEESVREYCRERLAHFKVPRHVRLVDAFPQTVTGKIQKFRIREQMIAELGLDEPETA